MRRRLLAAALVLLAPSPLAAGDEAAREALLDTAEGVARDAVGAHSDQGRLVAMVGLAEEREAWLRAMVDQIRRSHAEGTASATDLAQAEARLAAAQADLARLRGELKRAEARYESVVGQPPPGAGTDP